MIEFIEGKQYTQTGWRPGDSANLENRPSVRHDEEAWNDCPDKREFNRLHRELADSLALGYEAALTPELKAERSRLAEERMMAEAHAFYASRAPGDNRSFWD